MKIKINDVDYDLNFKLPKINVDCNPINNSINMFFNDWVALEKKELRKKERQLRVDKLNNIDKND